jgi:hypothetical protein
VNAFEQIVSKLFQSEGYWTINGFRVELTKEEKKAIDKPSMPRPELDVLAYQGKTNELIWVECKSYLDSRGVRYSSFRDESDPGYVRYKVFNFKNYRDVVTNALIRQAILNGLTKTNPTVNYCLVAGKVHSEIDRKNIQEYFKKNKWMFYDANSTSKCN